MARWQIGMARVALALAVLLGAVPADAQKRIALTFDDVPRDHGAFLTPDQRTEALIAALGRAGVRQAAFFVNPEHLLEPDGVHGAAHIRAYVAAGHVIANHSYDHPHLSELTARGLSCERRSRTEMAQGPQGRSAVVPLPVPRRGRGGQGQARRGPRGAQGAAPLCDGRRIGLEHGGSGAARGRGAQGDRYGGAARPLCRDDGSGGRLLRRAGDQDDRPLARARDPAPRDRSRRAVHRGPRRGAAQGRVGDRHRRRGLRRSIRTAMPDTPSAQGTLIEALAWEKGLPRWYDRDNTAIANALFAERVLHETPAPPAPTVANPAP
ncbi:MAG: polysaccharide deacetylase family protein [Sphingomonas sp.]